MAGNLASCSFFIGRNGRPRFDRRQPATASRSHTCTQRPKLLHFSCRQPATETICLIVISLVYSNIHYVFKAKTIFFHWNVALSMEVKYSNPLQCRLIALKIHLYFGFEWAKAIVLHICKSKLKIEGNSEKTTFHRTETTIALSKDIYSFSSALLKMLWARTHTRTRVMHLKLCVPGVNAEKCEAKKKCSYK